MRALKALILVATLVWVGKMFVGFADDLKRGEVVLHADLRWLALSAIIVLATYGLLIWSWLYIVAAMSGKSIPFVDGARIWFVSNVAVIIPGRVWGIVQMSAMSVDAGINPAAAAASSVVNTAINIATGMAIGLLTAAPVIASALGGRAWAAWPLAGLAVVGILALPILVPWGFRILRSFGLKVPEAAMPPSVIAISAVANLAAWFMYGAAFLCLNRGFVDPTAHSVAQHTAAFTTSYVIGYMMIVAPAGLGFREKAMQEVLLVAGMATPAQATAITLISRIWLLIIQILPALIFLAYRRPLDEKDPTAR